MEKDVLKHYGVEGMKWGVRRYQNADGSLTAAGRKRYGVGAPETAGHIGVNKKKNNVKVGASRYRNKDGSLTEAGKKRYEKDIRANNAKKKDNRIVIDGPDPDRWVSEDLEKVEKTARATQDVVRKAKDIERRTRPQATKVQLDLSGMSDKELRDTINRANLERQYNDLFAPEIEPQISLGRKIANGILEYGDEVLTIGTSAVALAVALSKFKR